MPKIDDKESIWDVSDKIIQNVHKSYTVIAMNNNVLHT